MSSQSVFIYELITSGGLYHTGSDPPQGSLLAEGRAMLGAIVEDFAKLPDVVVSMMGDARLDLPLPAGVRFSPVHSAEEETDQFQRLSAACDRTLVIAPEFDGWLLAKTRAAVANEAGLISSLPEFIEIAADKCLTIDRLGAAQVPVPSTIRFRRGEPVPRNLGASVIVKPVDGAGSNDVRRMHYADLPHQVTGPGEYCLQQFCPGRAASVAAICGHGYRYLLPGCWQSVHPRSFAYQGGSTIDDARVQRRLRRLAQLTLDALPSTIGYVGIDLIVGAAVDGSQDRVIEVNPRLTTSYVGLRAITNNNLAQAILSAVDGQQVDLSFGNDPVEFLATGEVSRRGLPIKPEREGQVPDELVGDRHWWSQH